MCFTVLRGRHLLLTFKEPVEIAEIAEPALICNLRYRHIFKTQHLPRTLYAVIIEIINGSLARYLLKDLAQILRIEPRSARHIGKRERL